MTDAPTELARLTTALAASYAIEHELGRGGMATVYLAKDLRHERRVAIKVLHPELSAILGADRFLAEIKLTAALQHPHILPLFDSGSADGLLFYVMPFIDGETLRSRLEREKQLPVDDAIRLVQQVASALDAAHRKGVIHRDIKPENILLHDGQALVADFGIALAVQHAGGQRMTQTGLSLGTPQYMSPEQAMGEREITARSDVYALGAVTYEMLVGEAPFSGPSVQAIMARVITEQPRSIMAERRSVPPHVDAAVLRALEKIPADRFGTAAEFAAAIDGRGMATSYSGATAASPSHSRFRRAAPWAAAAVALAAGLSAGRFLARPSAAGVAYTQQTFNETVITLARLAPDGKTIVFSAAPAGQSPSLWIVRPDYAEPQPLAGAGTHLLGVSSQGELAVLTGAEIIEFKVYSGTLARMPLGGGAPRALVEHVHDADWATDGQDLAIVRTVGGKDRLEYPAGKVLVETAGWISDPRFSRDGRTIAFVEHPWRWDNRGTINMVTLSGTRTVLSAEEYSKINGVARSRDGDVFFSANSSLAPQKVILAVTPGGKVRMALNGAGGLTIEDVDAGGRWLVARDTYTLQLMLRTPKDTVARDVGWLDYPFSPVLSDDARQLAFSIAGANSGVNYSVMLRDTDGGKAARLGPGEPLQFSRDSRWILSVVPSRPAKVVIYPSGAGTERTVNTAGFEVIETTGWGPDEQSVWFCGSSPGRATTCMLSPLAGGVLRPLPTEVLAYATDGRSLLVGGGARRAMAQVTLAGDTLRKIPLGSGDSWIKQTFDGHSLMLRHRGSVATDLLDLDSGTRRLLFSDAATAGSPPVRSLAVSADRRTYAYQPYRASTELFTVEGAR